MYRMTAGAQVASMIRFPECLEKESSLGFGVSFSDEGSLTASSCERNLFCTSSFSSSSGSTAVGTEAKAIASLIRESPYSPKRV